jgi:hypothetical protein
VHHVKYHAVWSRAGCGHTGSATMKCIKNLGLTAVRC